MRKLLTLTLIIALPMLFCGQIGPWSHFRAVTSDFTVPSGDTLTINAGSEIRFAPGIKLIINGIVFSNGTKSEPVIFSGLSPSNPTWGGVIISNSTPGVISTFNNTVFTKINLSGNGSVNIGESNVEFNGCSFISNAASGSGGAVYLSGGNASFSSCIFKENTSGANGGAVCVINSTSAGASSVTVTRCEFISNTALNGGGLYIFEDSGALYDMTLNVTFCGFFSNNANMTNGNGGGVYFYPLIRTDFDLKFCKIQLNRAYAGGGVYALFDESTPRTILPAVFSNLLVTQNTSHDGAGIRFNAGKTQNPSAFTFINNTLAYNKILITKITKAIGGGGIHILSFGNYPVIRNSILWGNTGYSTSDNQYMICDYTYPSPANVFHYCNIQNEINGGPDCISSNPLFIRPPSVANAGYVDPERFDYHLSIMSPSIDAGDPLTPCTEPNSTRVNQGAYGNTIEARIPLSGATVINAGTSSDVFVNNYGVTVLDFQFKAKEFNYNSIYLGTGAQLHLKGSSYSTINIGSLISAGGTKFDEQRVLIQKAVQNSVDLTVQALNITNTLYLNGANFSDLNINVIKSGAGKVDPTVNLYDTKVYSSSVLGTNYGISVSDAAVVNINSSSIDNFNNGIQVKNVLNKSKATGIIANNSVCIDPDTSTKAGVQIGMDISDSQIDVENNEIDVGEGGEIGVQMSNSSGRISNNTVNFETDTATKDSKLTGKTGINLKSGSNNEVDNNNIWVLATNEFTINGINVDNSLAKISYNKINFAPALPIKDRNGVVLNCAQNGTYLYNNTFYNTRKGLLNTPATAKVNVINNIFWNENAQNLPDTAKIRFFNNDFKSGLPSGIVGSGNISSDPLCIDPDNNDLVIATNSPCINTGYLVSGFHIADSTYFGSAPEIGAVEYYEITLAAPSNVTTGINAGNLLLSWNSVSGATCYNIYSCDTPYGTFTPVTTVYTNSWSTAVSSAKKFYYIKASTGSKIIFTADDEIKVKTFDQIKNDPAVVITKKKIRIKEKESR